MSRSTLAALSTLSAACCLAGIAAAPTAAAAPPEQARLAGCEFGRIAGTYDYADFGAHVSGMREVTTGDFRDQFEQAQPTIQAGLAANHTRAEVNSVDCRIVSGDANQADVTLTVVQTTTSDATAGLPKTNKLSLLVTVVHVDGRWLVNRAETD